MSTSKVVLDSYALLVFLKMQDGWERVRDLLSSASIGEAELHLSAINYLEVRYISLRTQAKAEQALRVVDTLPIRVESADAYIRQVADLKAKFPISLGDCFAAALAMEMDCPVLTGDPEFRKLEGTVKVEWLP